MKKTAFITMASILALAGLASCASSPYGRVDRVEYLAPQGASAEQVAVLLSECGQGSTQGMTTAYTASSPSVFNAADRVERVSTATSGTQAQGVHHLAPCLAERGFEQVRMNEGQHAVYTALSEEMRAPFAQQVQSYWAAAQTGQPNAAALLPDVAYVKAGTSAAQQRADAAACQTQVRRQLYDMGSEVRGGAEVINEGWRRATSRAHNQTALEIACFTQRGYQVTLIPLSDI